MPIGLLKDIINSIPRGVRLLGLDVGQKTIGLALADPDMSVVTPHKTIQRTKFTRDAAEIAKIIAEYEVGGLIIGLPLNMDGTEGPRVQSCRAFARNLDRIQPVNVAFWDERLSTSAVERFLIEELDLNRKRRANVVDRTAAAWILQGALDRLRP